MTIHHAAPIAVLILLSVTLAACLSMSGGEPTPAGRNPEPFQADSSEYVPVRIDSILPPEDIDTRYSTLTNQDFSQVAAELQVEVAAIKAVVVIEAGKQMEGFWGPGAPVINCDKSLWNTVAKKVVSRAKAPVNSTIPPGLKHAYARKAWQKLVNARKICIDQANLCTFWGMFQIGGFNYKLCGCTSIQEFVKLMSDSELEQLELFAALITNTGQVKHLRAKDWAAFARAYNGPSYAKKGYHTRMAAAYKRFKGN